MPITVLAFLSVIAIVPGYPLGAIDARWGVVGAGSAIIWAFARSRGPAGPAHWLGAALFLWIIIGLSWSVSEWETLGGLLRFAALGFAFLLATSIDDLTPFWRGLVGGAVLSAIVMATQMIGLLGAPGGMAAGLFAGKSPAAEIAVLGLIGIAAIARANNDKTFLLMGSAPIGCILWLRSREAVLALAAAAVVWSIARYGRRLALSVIGFLAFCIVPIGLSLLVTGHLGQFMDRITIWQKIVPHVGPWGDGLGALAIAAPAWESAYNEFLQFAFELGVGSALIWGIALYALGADRPSERAALAAILAMCCVAAPLHNPATAFAAAILAGHLCGVHDRVRAGRDHRRRDGVERTDGAEYLGVGAVWPADVARLDLPAQPGRAVGGG